MNLNENVLAGSNDRQRQTPKFRSLGQLSRGRNLDHRPGKKESHEGKCCNPDTIGLACEAWKHSVDTARRGGVGPVMAS